MIYCQKKNLKNLKSENGILYNEEIKIDQIDYYFTNAIARSSKTMSDCRIAKNNNKQK